MNQCTVCAEEIALMPAYLCGPRQSGDCPCCGLEYIELDTLDDEEEE